MTSYVKYTEYIHTSVKWLMLSAPLKVKFSHL